jgi:hypothetical protein
MNLNPNMMASLLENPDQTALFMAWLLDQSVQQAGQQKVPVRLPAQPLTEVQPLVRAGQPAANTRPARNPARSLKNLILQILLPRGIFQRALETSHHQLDPVPHLTASAFVPLSASASSCQQKLSAEDHAPQRLASGSHRGLPQKAIWRGHPG